MESFLPKKDQVCSTVTPAKKQQTITNVTDRNKEELLTKLIVGIAYKLALKQHLHLTALNFAIKALRRYVNIIEGSYLSLNYSIFGKHHF